MASKVNDNVKKPRPKRVFGCRPYDFRYKTGDEQNSKQFFGGIIIYAHKREDIDKFIENHPVDVEYRINDYDDNVTMPTLCAREHKFHGINVGMFFLDKNADVECPDEMSERKFDFLYNHLPSGCGTFDCENLYHKMFEEDYPDCVADFD